MEKKNNKKLSLIILSIALLIILAGVLFLVLNHGDKEKQGGSSEPDRPYNPNEVTLDNFTFAPLKLETNEENLVYSPLSIKYALSMLSEGAKGETKEEIDKLIKDLSLTKYENIENILSLANSIFIRDIYKEKVNEEYTNILKDNYNAEVIYDEFKDASNINKWIEDKTFNIIKNMLSDDQVQNPDVKLLLINALAIDMEWLSKFDAEDTTSRPFKKDNGEEVEVAMMHKNSETNEFYKDSDFSALSMPFKNYNGTELEFITIMPNNGNLKEILTSDNMNEKINSILNNMKKPDKQRLSISIPRFDFEFKTSLKEDLQKMGIKRAFSDTADFTNISDTGLHVDDVLHKANIKCSEKGVKAAAVTVILMKDNAMPYIPEEKEIVYLNFNKPFMFIIRDTNTKEVWFVGTIYDPILWENAKSDYDYQ